MAETTATETESKSAPGSTFTEFNVRQDGGRPHFIRLHDRVVKSLERQLAAVSGGNARFNGHNSPARPLAEPADDR